MTSFWEWADRARADGWKLLLVATNDDHPKPVVLGPVDELQEVLFDLVAGNLVAGDDYVHDDGLPCEVCFYIFLFVFLVYSLFSDSS